MPMTCPQGNRYAEIPRAQTHSHACRHRWVCDPQHQFPLMEDDKDESRNEEYRIEARLKTRDSIIEEEVRD